MNNLNVRPVRLAWLPLLSVVALAACDDGGGELELTSTTRTYPATRTDFADILSDIFDDALTTPDTVSGPETTADIASDTTTGPTSPTGPFTTNAGFIGSACAGTNDCNYTDSICLGTWPNGHCSQSCERFCPDRAGLATTFCMPAATVDPGETGGRCVQRCDFGQSPTGCRAGYTCRNTSRFNEAAVTAPVCIPGDGPPDITDCIGELARRGIDFQLATNPMDSPDGGTEICDVLDPVRISGTINGVTFRYANFDANVGTLFVRCPVALALWDTAELAKSTGIVAFTHLGTYNCRYIGGTQNLSQHAFANAIDISGVRTTTGATYTLLNDWERGVSNPTTPGGKLLRDFAHEMHRLGLWNIILTPEFNSAHWDHFHIDLTEGASSLR